MNTPALTDQEFMQFQKLIYRIAGIHMSPVKKPLVTGRLAKRLNQYGLRSYGEYFKLLNSGSHPAALQMAVALLTTNETYFFREPKHFEFLQKTILPSHTRTRPIRVWSAACSSGQEPYSVAMTLADLLGDSPWDVLASDISTRVLDSKLRQRIKFAQINLNESLPRMETLDLIFLRNVMIYFDAEVKRKVVRQLVETLKPGGYLFIGHSESLNGIYDGIAPIAPAIYRKA